MNLLKINEYIDNLYEASEGVNKDAYIHNTELKDFIPVVDQDVSRLLALILRLTKAKKVLEIGTSIGYSTVSMANILKEHNGNIVTVEYDKVVANQAKRNFINAGVQDIVDIRIGDAKEIIPLLKEEFDLIFLDVDKRLYAPLLNDCVRLLKKGGVLIAEDTLFPVIDLADKWKYLIPHIQKFNEEVISNDELESTILPIGDGVTLAFKK